MTIPPVDVRTVEAIALSVPLETPLPASFGSMDARSTLLIRLCDAQGRVGWGEVWCNFPTFGALHRARLAERIVGPILTEAASVPPLTIAAALEARLATLALQTGEFGPIAQVIGGLEMAVWDLAGQSAGVPIHRLFGSQAEHVPAYASGINPTDPVSTIRAAQRDGYRSFKVKIGFDPARDLQNIAASAAALAPGDRLMVDANQAFDPPTARTMAVKLAPHGLAWLEEPLPASASDADWRAVAAAGIPLAAGENMRGLGAFTRAIDAGWLAVAQPDAGKWGGFAGGLAVAKRAHEAGRRFCPHHLGGAIGLYAAAHLLAAAGGDGLLEVDTNDNPLRTALVGALPSLREGAFPLPRGAGLGVSPDNDIIARYRIKG